MKTKSKCSGYIIHNAAAAVLLLFAIVGFTSAVNLANRLPRLSSPSPVSGKVEQAANGNRTICFADRVAYQRAIEEVYWRHRIWPEANGNAKPSLEEVMPQAQIEKKVEDYLRESQALADYWQKPITPEQ